jgi:DNA-nicking Smr family endonuclease
MTRKVRPEEHRLWGLVTSTVRPAEVKARAVVTLDAPMLLDPLIKPRKKAPAQGAPDRIEPNRRRRIARTHRAELPLLDLHGFDQIQARAALSGFIARAYRENERAVLVITGKGVRGDGVLRRRLPEWLAEPDLRMMVAGLSHADPHHGGEGAVYVALKRREPT